MTRIASRVALLALALCSLAPLQAQAGESYDNCVGVISALPATVSTPGTWCLKQNLATSALSGSAIAIGGNNITIDCNNFKLSGSAAGLGTATIGISSNNRLNLTVRHCDISGFAQGIRVLGTTGGHLIEDNRLDANTYLGINVQGSSSTIRHNQVINTGQSTVQTTAYGIFTSASVDVLDNTIAGVVVRAGSGGNSFGIYTSGNPDGTISGNRVREVVGEAPRASYGIYNFNSGRIILRENDVVGDASVGSVGLTCSTASARLRNNVINGFATAIKVCGNAGGNDSF